jgi:hypothetical protein
MKNANLSDAELTEYSGYHLLYELQYFRFTAGELARQTGPPNPMASVLLESFGIHLRNLIDFFYIPTGKERDGDVIASDLCPGWSETISKTLEVAKERASKEISHLTLDRKKESDSTKPWDVAGLFQEVSDVAKRFAAQAPPTKLSPKVPKWLNMFYGGAMNIAVGGAMIASNTTTAMVTTTIAAGGAAGNVTNSMVVPGGASPSKNSTR